MWIFTETGFVSAVRHFKEKDKLVVRARDQKSLEGLANSVGLGIIAWLTGRLLCESTIEPPRLQLDASQTTRSSTLQRSRDHDCRAHDF